MSLTVTFRLWWLGAYLLVGVVTWLPMNAVANRQIASHPRLTLVGSMRDLYRRSGFLGFMWLVVVQVALWPAALWELCR